MWLGNPWLAFFPISLAAAVLLYVHIHCARERRKDRKRVLREKAEQTRLAAYYDALYDLRVTNVRLFLTK